MLCPSISTLSGNCNTIALTLYHSVAIEVCATHTMATIEWQDGTQSENVPTTQLVHVNHIDDNDFCPGDFLYRENAGKFVSIVKVSL